MDFTVEFCRLYESHLTKKEHLKKTNKKTQRQERCKTRLESLILNYKKHKLLCFLTPTWQKLAAYI
eukprot:UN19252